MTRVTRRAYLLVVLTIACLLYLHYTHCSSPAPRGWGMIPVLDEEEVAVLLKSPTGQELRDAIEKLRALHKELGEPRPGDWLAVRYEPGQTFEEYLACNPATSRGKRNKIYIQPLGEFSDSQRKIVTLTADFMCRYFNVPVEIEEDLPLSVIPGNARRVHPSWGGRQILTTYVLYDVLRPRLPEDAAAYIAFTTSDLWAGEDWNFVFGEASLFERVGVWSIHRFGDPDKGKRQFKETLLRTMKLSTHETGHMFSMLHCIVCECNMCGNNNLEERDRQPVWLCPECMAKVCWATGTDPLTRYRKLARFCKEHGLTRERAFFDKSIKALSGD